MMQNKTYQVVICGGGLAGLTLSIQLKKRFPNVEVTVIEKTTRPLPDAAHKVGESTVEIGGHYFSQILGLKSYLDDKQFPKLGLRYFYGNSLERFEDRPELGPSMFSPVPTFQLDRGTFETDLRAFAVEHGVNLLEGASLVNVELNENGGKHLVSYSIGEEEKTVEANWVVDAMGRRRYLQTKLGLKTESPHKASSVWFRLEGKVSVSDLVDKNNSGWQKRNLEDRYYSTNHLMGLGYWVWLIPLASGNTSVGIVTQDDLHDFPTYSRNYATSLEWLDKHEPHLANHIRHMEPLDFRKIKNYSYGSKQLFSANRWSCVGEAGIFSDPFYSPGSDMIAITNTFTSNLIGADLKGELTEEKAAQLNNYILETMFPDQLSYYVEGYHTFGNSQIAATKFLWDTLYYWRVYAHAFMSGVFEDFDRLKAFEKHVKELSKLNRSLQTSFRIQAEKQSDLLAFDYTDLARKGLFIESAVELLTRQAGSDYEEYLQRQFVFFSEMKTALEAKWNRNEELAAFAPFKAFYGSLNATEKRKNSINGFISRIAEGKFLYSVRYVFIQWFVKEKPNVNLAFILRWLYAP